MKKVLEGSHAVSEAVRLARVEVISAYPITPQTHIVELLSEYCATGLMKAKFLRVESEHSALAALIGASTTGVRTFTATSSQGLAYMHELIHWAAGARLPIVMAVVNRALAPGWNIWTDQTDTLSQRDTGWLQFYCEDAQEALDTTIMAYKLAETVNLPVMVILDAFFLSHTYEPVDIPDQNAVDDFLPPFEPKFKLDTSNPCAFNQLSPPNVYMEMRYSIHRASLDSQEIYKHIEKDFHKAFGRSYGLVEAVNCEDAEIIMVTSGTVTSTCRLLIDELRSTGEKVGLLKIKAFRPFPRKDIIKILKSAKKICVIDRNISFGAMGIFAQEIRAVFCNEPKKPQIFGFIAGLGGRDITVGTLKNIYTIAKESTSPEHPDIWIDLQKGILQ